jgi:hypothetical protein
MRRHASVIRGKSLPRRPHVDPLEARLLLTSATALETPDPGTLAGISANYGQFPMSFEANQGQTDGQVSFLTRGPGYALFLTPNEAVLSLETPTAPTPAAGAVSQAAAGDVLRVQLIGANVAPSVIGLDQLPGTTNYLIGDDPSRWHTDIPNYAQVEEQGVYSGVDVTYHGNQQQLEYDFTVAPGADPGVIRLAIQGADSMSLDAGGNLVLHTAGGNVVEQAPVLYQEIGAVRQAVSGHFLLAGDGEVSFAVGAYDTTKVLVIDPTLSYSTYLGGSGGEGVNAIAVDASGDAYVTGITSSTDFPTASALQPAVGSNMYSDAFVAKLNASGSALIYSTYLGGSSSDEGRGIAVDTSGDAYVTGITSSTDFPTASPLQSSNAGGAFDAFVAELNASGSALIYSTYLGGSGSGGDAGDGITLDASRNAYVAGFTGSTDFPITPGAFQTVNSSNESGDTVSAFVAKLNAAGSALVYSTYLGGSGRSGTEATAIAIDSAGNAYVTGATNALNFPTVNPLQSTGALLGDAFVTKLNATGSALVYSTYLGGGAGSSGSGIAVDASGNAYVTGSTDSTDFPTASALQSAFGGGSADAFVAKIDAAGSALVYSTFLGGSGNDVSNGVAVDASGNAYVTGYTSSTDFPTADPLPPANAGGPSDAFVAEFNTSGSALVYSTYLGGSSSDGDSGDGITVDASGNAYVVGFTGSTDFPTTPGSLQPAFGGGSDDGFITKLAPGKALAATTSTLTSSSNPSVVGQTVTFTAVVAPGAGTGPPTGSVTFSLDGQALGSVNLATVDGVDRAVFTTSTLLPGTHSVTVYYSGDANFSASASTPSLTQVVAEVATTTTLTSLTSSSNPSVVGQTVTFTAVVAPGAGTGPPTGSVTFSLDGQALGSANLATVDGVDRAVFTTSTLLPGTHSVAVYYSGDANFSASASTPPLTQVVAEVATTTTLTSSSSASAFGEGVTFTAVVAPGTGTGTPTGSVTFTLDGRAQPPVNLAVIDGLDQATFTTSTLAVGGHTLTAFFSGDPTFGPSASSALSSMVKSSSPPPKAPLVSPDGPLVMNFQRFGYHSQPTVVVLTFNKALDPATADSAANYRIVPLGRRGKPDTAISIKRISYNAADRTVTLQPSRRLNVHDRFELSVDGTSTHAVVDLALDALDGGKTGKAGSDYLGTIDWSAIAGPSLRGKRYAKAWRKLVASDIFGH